MLADREHVCRAWRQLLAREKGRRPGKNEGNCRRHGDCILRPAALAAECDCISMVPQAARGRRLVDHCGESEADMGAARQVRSSRRGIQYILSRFHDLACHGQRKGRCCCDLRDEGLGQELSSCRVSRVPWMPHTSSSSSFPTFTKRNPKPESNHVAGWRRYAPIPGATSGSRS